MTCWTSLKSSALSWSPPLSQRRSHLNLQYHHCIHVCTILAPVNQSQRCHQSHKHGVTMSMVPLLKATLCHYNKIDMDSARWSESISKILSLRSLLRISYSGPDIQLQSFWLKLSPEIEVDLNYRVSITINMQSRLLFSNGKLSGTD